MYYDAKNSLAHPMHSHRAALPLLLLLVATGWCQKSAPRVEDVQHCNANIYDFQTRNLLYDPGGGTTPKYSRWVQVCGALGAHLVEQLANNEIPPNQDVSLKTQRPPGLKVPRDYGVGHAELTGPLTLINGSIVYATVLIYYRPVLLHDRLGIRAQAHFLDIDHDRLAQAPMPTGGTWTFPYHEPPAFMTLLAQHPLFYLWPSRFGKAVLDASIPNITLHQQPIASLDSNLMHPADASSEWNPPTPSGRGVLYEGKTTSTLPYLVNATLPTMKDLEEAGITDMYLSVGNFSNRVLLTLASLTHMATPYQGPPSWAPHHLPRPNPHPPPPPPRVVSVIQPMYHGGFDSSAAMLQVHIAFHTRVGIDATMLYERGSFVSACVEHRGLLGYMRQGLLELMLWDRMHGAPAISASVEQLELYADEGLTFDQDFFYNHALLCHWGRNTYLYFTDADDFLKIPPGSTVKQIIDPSTALCSTWHTEASYMQFSRWNYKCDSDAPPLLEASKQRRRRRHLGQRHIGPLTTSSTPTPTPPHPTNTTLPDGAVLRHLHCYLRNTGHDKPKIIVHADATAYVEIHYGVVFDHALTRAVWIPEDCAGVAHLYELRGGRAWGGDVELVDDRGWMWPLYELAAGGIS